MMQSTNLKFFSNVLKVKGHIYLGIKFWLNIVGGHMYKSVPASPAQPVQYMNNFRKSQHKKMSNRNIHRHQNVSYWNKTQRQKLSTRNKPKNQKLTTRTN